MSDLPGPLHPWITDESAKVVIAAVSKRCGDERERTPRQAQDHTGAIPVLNVSRLGLQDQTRPSVSTITWRLRPLTFLPAS